MKSLLFASLSLAVVLASSCGTTTCERMCMKANTCGVKDRAFDYDCPEYCADVVKQQKRMEAEGAPSCATEFKDYLKCWEQNVGSICSKDFTGCADAASAWTSCTATFCEAKKEKDPNCACAGVDAAGNCLGYETTLAPF